MYAHPQVYVDLGVIDWTRPFANFHDYLRRLIEVGFGNRILFGSDQMVWPEAISIAITNIMNAKFLSEDQKKDILYRNAQRFLRLKEFCPKPTKKASPLCGMLTDTANLKLIARDRK